jgi:hypothetical protein
MGFNMHAQAYKSTWVVHASHVHTHVHKHLLLLIPFQTYPEKIWPKERGRKRSNHLNSLIMFTSHMF